MAISDRINEMYTHIGDVYDTITNVDLPTNKNIQNIPSTMRSSYLEIMNNGIDKIWNNWEKVTGEGETLTLNSTEEAPMKINLKGNTSQETTTGKNLLAYPYYDTTKTINGITFTDNGDGTINANGTASANASFFLLGNAKNQEEIKGNYISGGARYNVKVRAVNLTSGTYTVLGSSEGSPTSLNKSTYSIGYIEIVIVNGTTVNNLTIKPMLTNNEDSDYEPYTNGASPNPDYPQDIHVVSGDNEINVIGKNLLKLDFVTERPTFAGLTFTHTDSTFTLKGTTTGTWTIFNLKEKPLIENGATYTFSANITGTNPSMKISCYFWNKSGQQIDNIRMSKNNNYEITKTINFNGPDDLVYSYATFVIESLTNNSAYDLSAEVQLERNNTKTNFEQYQSASYEIDLRTSKNLFDISTITENTYIEDNGNTGGSQVTNLSDYIEVKPNTKYTLSYDYSTLLNQNQRNFVFYDENKTYISGYIYLPINKTNTITTPSNAKYLRFSYDKSCNSIMINEGSTAQPYEPYNSIELCKIGDYQDSIKKSSGKNLFDKDSISNGFLDESGIVGGDTSAYRTSDFIPILPNIAYYKTTTSSPRTKYYDKNKQPLNTTTYWDIPIGGNAGTFTTPSNAYYFRFSYPVTGVNANSIMINKGTTAIPYEPYGKDWYLNKQIGKVAFSDLVFNEIGGNFSQFSTNGNIAMVYLQNDLKVTGNRDDVFCNLLKPYSSSLFGGLQTGINQYYNATKLLLSVPLANVEEFAGETLTVNNYLSYTQNYIKGLEGYIYYILATPTYTEITDSTLLSQLEALNGSKSYTTQTNITQENNDKPFILDATALKQLTTEEI